MISRLVHFVTIAVVIVGAVVAPSPVSAETRIALVIGNSAYRSVARLPNPANDAAAMGDLFRAAGFEVQIANDLGASEFRKALRSFATKAPGASFLPDGRPRRLDRFGIYRQPLSLIACRSHVAWNRRHTSESVAESMVTHAT
jgi:hypothetical protein